MEKKLREALVVKIKPQVRAELWEELRGPVREELRSEVLC